jgi:AcrR family transcriptional regulator
LTKEQAILISEQGLFAEFVLKKVTMEDISKAAHVSKATVYKHFRNKTEVFDRVIEMEARVLLSAIRAAVDAEPTVVGKFRVHLLTRMAKAQELMNFYRVTKESWGDFLPHLAKLGKWFLEEEKKVVRQIMQQGIDEGALEVERLDVCTHVAVVALQSIEFPWALETHELPGSEYADMMIHMMYNGIRKR